LQVNLFVRMSYRQSTESQTDIGHDKQVAIERDKEAAHLAGVAAELARNAATNAEAVTQMAGTKKDKKLAAKAAKYAQERATAATQAAEYAVEEVRKTRDGPMMQASSGKASSYWDGALGWQRTAELNLRTAREQFKQVCRLAGVVLADVSGEQVEPAPAASAVSPDPCAADMAGGSDDMDEEGSFQGRKLRR
jgi:hypothetical protein